MTFTKIAKLVTFCWTKWLPELKIEQCFKQHPIQGCWAIFLNYFIEMFLEWPFTKTAKMVLLTVDEKAVRAKNRKKLWMPSPPSYGCCTRVNFVSKKHLLFQMNLSNSGLKNRSIKEYWLIFTVLKFPLGLQFSHNLTKFKIIKYISTIYIMTTTCTYLQQLTQVSDVAHGPLVLKNVENCKEKFRMVKKL